MTIATTEPRTAPPTGAWGRDADLDVDIDVEAAFAELICADPDLVDVEFAAIVAELGQPGTPAERPPVPAPGPAPRGGTAPRPAASPLYREARANLEGRSRQRSPPDR
ncbi:hypothetical protein N865_09140 [Intrasporangium oryzae NRRL B-24470]|uniref:Uncharacterized protein n=1 Tax=Intrasporangium oryzae NRRL B-24470 TaxID=1386089 RepID=W9GEG2_9MICO|nr:hypothetical protein [Intrasporangium oryzae]EWT03602.1 hypothetical protein N865_09140 [Intrasporangium oryzae NRRL B-24470]